MITFLYDEYQPYSCLQWGLEGNEGLPIIVNDGVFTNDGLDFLFFGNVEGVPKYVFIDKNLELHHKQTGYMTETSILEEINIMLEEN